MTPAEAAAIRARAAGLRAEARALEEFLDAQEARTTTRRGVRPPDRPVDPVTRKRAERALAERGIVPAPRGDDDA